MTASESDYLFRLAALSLTFVGFSSVVVTLQGRLGGELSDRHLRFVRMYIEGGFLVTALALVPSLLGFVQIPGAWVWPLSSGVAGAIFSLILLIQFRRRRQVESGRFPVWVIVIYILSGAVVGALWFNAVGVPSRSHAGPYAVALTWALGVFGFIFVHTIELFLQRPPPDDSL